MTPEILATIEIVSLMAWALCCVLSFALPLDKGYRVFVVSAYVLCAITLVVLIDLLTLYWRS